MAVRRDRMPNRVHKEWNAMPEAVDPTVLDLAACLAISAWSRTVLKGAPLFPV